jgi:hypothetical protein
VNIEIISATVFLIEYGTDRITLKTRYPCPFVKDFLPTQPQLTLTFDATKGTGVDYVRRVFGIEPKVIET